MKNLSVLIIIFFVIINMAMSQTVTIGKQVWMIKNLDVDKFRNGDPIPQAKTIEEMEVYSKAGEPAWCYYDFDKKNGTKYGKMYNGFAIIDPRGLSPEGWHMPSYSEFQLLVDYLGGEETARFKLKSKSGWAFNGNGTNSSGFSALPGGISAKGFLDIGYQVCYLSTTQTPPDSNFPENKFNYIMKLTYENKKREFRDDNGKISYFYYDDVLGGVGSWIGSYYYARCLRN